LSAANVAPERCTGKGLTGAIASYKEERSFVLHESDIAQERAVPRVSLAHLDARRGQILDAAAACFAQHGFHATTMQQICAAADLSAGAVYRYFPSKEEIIATLCEREFERAAALIVAAQDAQSFDQALAALLQVFFAEFETFAGCGNALDLELWAEASRNAEVRALCQRLMARLRGPLCEIVRRAQSRHEVNPALDPEAVAATGLAFFYGLVLQKVMEPALDVNAYAQAMQALLDGSFRAAARATEAANPPRSQGEA
jgi:AcrR family transcriptional regulator